MKTIFAFDTATTTTVCGLLVDGELVGEQLVEARSVLVAAERLTRGAGISPAEIEGLVVGTGPGSFTSIRIGLATARGLGLGLGVPAAGVSTLLAFAGGRPVIDARRGEVFTTGPRVCKPEELDVAGQTLVGDGAIRYRTLFEERGATIPPDADDAHVPDPLLLVEHAGDFGPAELVEPLYVRDPDAKPQP